VKRSYFAAIIFSKFLRHFSTHSSGGNALFLLDYKPLRTGLSLDQRYYLVPIHVPFTQYAFGLDVECPLRERITLCPDISPGKAPPVLRLPAHPMSN